MAPKPKLLIDLAPRYSAAFGFVPLLKPDVIIVPGAEYANFYRPQIYAPGNLYFEDLRLKNDEYDIDMKFGAAALTKSGKLGDLFAPPPMLGFERTKDNIVTKIDGPEAAEVVELYNQGVYEMEIQGLLVDMENHHFPLDKIGQLNEMFDVPGGFEVTSEICHSLNIHSIWFSRIRVTPVQGFEDTVQFSLTARATKPLEFFLNGEDASE